MQQFQAAILLSQIKRIQRDADVRDRNASYLTSRLKEIPGIVTLQMSDRANRSAYHIYPFRYQQQEFKNLPKRKFVQAMRAEGIRCGSGYYSPFRFGLIEEQVKSRGFQRLFSEQRLNEYLEDSQLPDTEQLSEETVIMTQNMLLGSRRDMDDITNAILKIRENVDKLLKS
jgi:dTDP-4-amino-4,6-dideoxygalactose transaminase